MYFCHGVTKDDNKRKGVFKDIIFNSKGNVNDWELHDGKIEIVDGDYLIFGAKKFGFSSKVTFDMLFCNDDIMYIKLLSGEIFVTGGADGKTILGVKEDGDVRSLETTDKTTVKWYTSETFRQTVQGSITHQNDMPEDFVPSTIMWNNLMFTFTCENALVKGKQSCMCVNVRTELIAPLEGYDYDKALNDARELYRKKIEGLRPESVAVSQERYEANKEAIDAAFEARQTKRKDDKPAKKATKAKPKKIKEPDPDDYYEDYDDDVEFDVDSFYDEDDDDYGEELQDAALDVQIAAATRHGLDYIDDSENI